jgi:hypothetical protein
MQQKSLSTRPLTAPSSHSSSSGSFSAVPISSGCKITNAVLGPQTRNDEVKDELDLCNILLYVFGCELDFNKRAVQNLEVRWKVTFCARDNNVLQGGNLTRVSANGISQASNNTEFSLLKPLHLTTPLSPHIKPYPPFLNLNLPDIIIKLIYHPQSFSIHLFFI